MSAPSPVNPEQFRRDLFALRKFGALLILCTLGIQFWGQWNIIAGLVVLAAISGVVQTVLIEWLAVRLGRPRAETLRLAFNLLLSVALGIMTQWALLNWLFIPFTLLWIHELGGQERLQVALFLVCINTVALLDGAEPMIALGFSLFGGICFLVTERRTALFQGMLAQVHHQREQLQQAQQRALIQEKLSSLGMLAAGVAHEINNPMSFVTSNIHSLYKDLQKEPALPGHLQEYVDDVLPATLDGVRRVNAIVADLRRFARGDPEAYAEYDLNVEAQAALRIAQGQLSHCQVRFSPGQVGMALGRAREICQVLVNLLANAGQATAPGGTVSLSTSTGPEGLRVDIRDTGQGMSPETLRQLFQPFFTTKAPGVGMGLGLAVAHGIITTHGGRIEVESQPQQGTCFTLHLPRVPPQPYRTTPPLSHASP